MEIPISEIAKIIGAEIIGDPNVTVKNINGITEADSGDLTFIMVDKYLSYFKDTKASAVLIKKELKQPEGRVAQLVVDDPQGAIDTLIASFSPPPIVFEPGIHPTAIVASDAILGKNVSVQPYAIIEAGVTIGDNCVIGAYCYVGHYTVLGNNVKLYPNVIIRERCSLGNNITIHSGTVIGADGFGYHRVDGKHVKIPQIGTVEIEDDVEIGANTCIDRARFDKTLVKKGTKIDNLVQIAHNCEVGENCIICGFGALSGSAKLGNNVIIAGQAGIIGHVKIADNTIVGAQCGVTKEITEAGFYIGSPATPHMTYKKRESVVVKLPELQKQIKQMQKQIDELLSK